MKHTSRKAMLKTAAAIVAAAAMGVAGTSASMAQENVKLFAQQGTGNIIMETEAVMKANDSKEVRLFMDSGEFSQELWDAATLTSSDTGKVEVQKNSFGGSNACSFNIYSICPGTSDVTLTYNGVAYVCRVTVEGRLEFKEESAIAGVGKTTFVNLSGIHDALYNKETKKFEFTASEWSSVQLTVSDDTILSAQKSATEPGKIELKGIAAGYCQLNVQYKELSTDIMVEVAGNSIYFGEGEETYSAGVTTDIMNGEEKIYYATDRFEGINEETMELAQCSSSDPIVASVELDRALSSNKAIAFKVKGISSGNAAITLTVGNETYMTSVHVITEKLSVESRDVQLMEGEEYPLLVSKTDDMKFPLSVMDGVTFKSSNKKAADVNLGAIKAKKAGKCMITVSYKDEFVNINVTVKAWASAAKNKKYKVKSKFSLADLYKVNAENVENISYSNVKSSDPKVVKVKKNGACVAKSAGKAVLTYSVNGHKYTTTIVVKG